MGTLQLPQWLEDVGVWTRRAVLTVLAVVVVAGIGALSVRSPMEGALAGAVLLALGFAAIDLGYLAVLCLPATFLMARAGGALSISDLVLFGAFVPAALLVVREEAGELRPLVWLAIVYQASLVPTLALNPYKANVIEWVHELVLVLGALVIGWVIGWQGRARLALSLYLVMAVAIGVCASVTALATFASSGRFEPVYLPGLHKNLIGNALAFATVLTYARPAWLRWNPRWAGAAMVVCLSGCLAAQAKQALVSVVVGILIVSLRSRRLGLRGWFMVAATVPLSYFVWQVVSEQLSSSNNFNSAHQRLTWYDRSIEIWDQSPLFGVGLRWWYTARFPDTGFQPPNVELEMLSSAGVLGLAGLVTLTIGAMLWLRTLSPAYGTIAIAIIAMRFTQGQFDLFWVAGMSSFPWLVTGIAVGALARSRHAEESTATVPSPEPARARTA
ncbi:O-antigen ligase family protein [Luteipulveratus sp. YIM 133132]|uniref:O-antigen ligase family protein n=1 Tax=Luteipulveratus flavus TaxID=3031728 RepID=UPI0023B19925|nr:O-antigen ligase family protein [Luteipulveratus sp. YIM 133132]MDE9364303.1 O-antigen ligase family protein [Luteipulveratus sp. YIM 133132]